MCQRSGLPAPPAATNAAASATARCSASSGSSPSASAATVVAAKQSPAPHGSPSAWNGAGISMGVPPPGRVSSTPRSPSVTATPAARQRSASAVPRSANAPSDAPDTPGVPMHSATASPPLGVTSRAPRYGLLAAGVRVPHQRGAPGGLLQMRAYRAGGVPAVVGDEHGVRARERLAHRLVRFAGRAAAPVDAHQRPPARQDARLHRQRAVQRQLEQPYPPAELLPYGLARGVVAERGHQDHVTAAPRGEGGGQPGAARVPEVTGDVDDRGGRVGGKTRGDPLDVLVEQDVAHHHQRLGSGHVSLPGTAATVRAGGAATAASKHSQSRCTATRWVSCTVAVEAAATHRLSSAASISGLGPGPVSAHTWRPARRAAVAAAIRLALRPDVDSSISTSPGRPCAATWRA